MLKIQPRSPGFQAANIVTNQTGLLAVRTKENALNFIAQDCKVNDSVRVTKPHKESGVIFPLNFKLGNGWSGKGSRVVHINTVDWTPVTHWLAVCLGAPWRRQNSLDPEGIQIPNHQVYTIDLSCIHGRGRYDFVHHSSTTASEAKQTFYPMDNRLCFSVTEVAVFWKRVLNIHLLLL